MKRIHLICLLFISVLINSNLLAQTGNIKGQIVDAQTNNPLMFANVVITGTNTGAQTDFDGNFEIPIAPGLYGISTAYIGYKNKEIDSIRVTANQTTDLGKILMEENVEVIGQVVIKGLKISDKVKRQPLTIETIKASEIREVASSDYYNSLENSPVDGTSVSRKKNRQRKKRKNPTNNNSTIQIQQQDQRVPESNTESYNFFAENDFLPAKETPLSTFSIDVDAASYSNVRRFIESGQKPNPNAVRIEEMINYFQYDYPQPTGEHPFAIHTELGDSPWNKGNYLLHIGLQGEQLPKSEMPPSNLVFLIDVSGSMSRPNKLGLVQKSLKLLTQQMQPTDRVALVVYAGSAGLVLPSTPFSDEQKILDAIQGLKSGGSTAGGAGIQLAYKVAKENFSENGNNRVILCTDGDFNVGVSSQEGLKELIEEKRKENIFLTVLGFGTGNYHDAEMEALSNAGNGNYGYIDNIKEAQKMLVNEMGGTLHTIAKDVKLQIEFNPAVVQSYRLIGYENRMLTKEDFNDDTKDAGELGAGHTVTAIYEIVPVDDNSMVASIVDELKYQSANLTETALFSGEWVTIKFRYKEPKEDKSILLERIVTGQDLYRVTNNFRFSAAVAYFGMLLRKSQFTAETFSFQEAIDLANSGKGLDEKGYRTACIELMEKAKELTSHKTTGH